MKYALQNESALASGCGCAESLGVDLVHLFRAAAFRRSMTSALLSIAVLAVVFAAPLHAESAASSNKTGNRLFEQGKYQDAEKAYLQAQGDMPGRPELSYNLGNALLKQKKYDQALQELRLAVSKGDKGLQANSWYNAGNALFDMGSFKDAAQAYIQALRLHPDDRDAKHNLELSLRKTQEQQEQKSQGSGQNAGKDKNEKQTQEKQRNQSQQEGRKPVDQQASGKEPPEGAFTRERALQILDAMQNQELAEQRRLLESQALRKVRSRDW